MAGPEEHGAVALRAGFSTTLARECSFEQFYLPHAAADLSGKFPVHSMKSSLESFRVQLL